MKKILAVLAVLSFGSAYAQVSDSSSDNRFFNIQEQEATAEQGQKHMIEFNAKSVPSLVYSMTKTKTKGTSSDNDSDTDLSFNYAYAVHPNIQVGGRFNYFNGVATNNDTERLDASVSGWLNSTAGDLQNSAYVSGSFGLGYAQTFGDNGGRDDLILSELAVGKRFGMERWGAKPLTWSPEIALTNVNSTSDNSFDFRQAVEFRVLQFSVIW